MRLLLVKTSSLGDVIHNLPVVTDIRQHFPDAQIDWCVEEAFADIPRLHPGVNRVLPVALRRWRRQLFQRNTWQQMHAAFSALGEAPYDAIIDTQGLVKSALLCRKAHGPRYGYDHDSVREPLASLAYHCRFAVARAQHAVMRNRALVGAALGFAPLNGPDYGLSTAPLKADWLPNLPYVVCLTATSRDDKLWPEAHWVALGHALHQQGFSAVFPAGSARERERAAQLVAQIPDALAAPSLNLPDLAALLAGGVLTVGVDTGLSHLAVALGCPTIALYTATDPGLTGVLGAGVFRNLGGAGLVPTVAEVLDTLAGWQAADCV